MTYDSEARFATCRSCRETAPLDELLQCAALKSGTVTFVHRPTTERGCFARTAKPRAVETLALAAPAAAARLGLSGGSFAPATSAPEPGPRSPRETFRADRWS